MKIRTGFVSNSSSSSYSVETCDKSYFCPYCYSNKEIKEIDDGYTYYKCSECGMEFSDRLLTLKDIRKMKLDEIEKL